MTAAADMKSSIPNNIIMFIKEVAMHKHNLLKSKALTAVVICMLLLAACGSDPAKDKTEQTPTMTGTEKEESQSVPSSTERETKHSETEPSETEPSETESSSETEAETPAASSETADNAIAEINGAADKNGIYSIVIRLTDQAADKAEIEMVYYGQKGTPQENSIVNKFRIEYEKGADGTYEIRTFFDGEVYQNQHQKAEVKVVNTFGAALRAGTVIISYTPDDGDTQEIFRADAEAFYTPTK